MSLMVSLELDRSSKLTAGGVSFIEAVVFCFASAAFLIGGVMLWALPNQPYSPGTAMSFGGWLGGMPTPVAVLALVAWAVFYLLFIFLYWAPPVVETAEGRRIHDYRRPFVAFVKVAAFWVLSAGFAAFIAGVAGLAARFDQAAAGFGTDLPFGVFARLGLACVPGWAWVVVAFFYFVLMSAYWSRLGMPGVKIPRVDTRFLGILTALAAGVVVYYIWVAAAYVLIGLAMRAPYEGQRWHVGDWLAATRTTVFVLATIVLGLIGFFYFRREQAPSFVGVMAKLFGSLLPLGKAAFFLLVSVASLVGFVAMFGLLFKNAEGMRWEAAVDLGRSLSLASAAPLTALAGGYLLLITAYWVPGRKAANIIELWGFSALLLIGAAFSGYALCKYLSTLDAWRDFVIQAADNFGLQSLRDWLQNLWS